MKFYCECDYNNHEVELDITEQEYWAFNHRGYVLHPSCQLSPGDKVIETTDRYVLVEVVLDETETLPS